MRSRNARLPPRSRRPPLGDRLASNVAPGVEPCNGVRVGALYVDDPDDLAVALEVDFGPSGMEHQTGGLVLYVGQGEGEEFRATQRGGVAEQDDRGVSDTNRGCGRPVNAWWDETRILLRSARRTRRRRTLNQQATTLNCG